MVRAVKQKCLQVQKSFISKSVAEDEIVADVAMRLNSNYSEMLKVLDENPRFGQQMVDKLVDLYQNIFRLNDVRGLDPMKNAEAAEVKQALELWTKAAQETGVDINDGVVYNSYDYSSQMPYDEKKQLEEYIMSKNNRIGQNLRNVDCTEIGNHFYAWRNNSKYDYTVSEMIEIEGNEDIIELIKGGIIDGTYGSSTSFDRLFQEYRNGRGSYNNNNGGIEESGTYRTDDRLSNRDEVESSGADFGGDGFNQTSGKTAEDGIELSDSGTLYSTDYSESADDGKKVSKVYSNSLQKKTFEGIRDEVRTEVTTI